jgi:chromosomal replication initiator protein
MTKTSEAWEGVLDVLKAEITRTNYDTWLRDTAGLSFDDRMFTVGVPNHSTQEWLEKRLLSRIKKILMNIMGERVELQFKVYPSESVERLSTTASPFNPKYTFNSFVVGDSNRLAHAAAMAVVKRLGKTYNPLFIYGGVGLGKTHLLQAIGHAAFHKGATTLYMSTDKFINEFINSIKSNRVGDFSYKFEKIDALLIDDIHFISGKEQTQEYLFHTFNNLHNTNRQIVFTSDRHPRALPLLEERLRSRFEWGLAVDIHPPDLETRIAILRRKSEDIPIDIEEDVLYFVARKIQGNVRELEGFLNRIMALANLEGVPPSLELARGVLQEMGIEQHQSVPPETIIGAVADYFRLETSALRKGEGRKQPIALARQIAMYLLREEVKLPLAEVGRLLGGRTHSTVIHGCEKIALKVDTNPKLRENVMEIKRRIYGQKL